MVLTKKFNLEHGYSHAFPTQKPFYKKGRKNEKNQNIDTPELSINGNIMSWHGSAIQLSNISSISTVELPLVPFPKWILLAFLAGAVLFKPIRIALCCLTAAVLYILYWHHQNMVIKKARKLMIYERRGSIQLLFSRQKVFAQGRWHAACNDSRRRKGGAECQD